MENQRGLYLAAEASVVSAQATASQARLAYRIQSRRREHDGGPAAGGGPEQARYDLDQTTFKAPTNGYVTQLFLRPGMMAVPLPLRPVMVFVHAEEQQLVAAFQQNALQRINVGDPAEVAFDAIPGQVFQGKVSQLIDVVSQGQLQPTGELLNPESRAGSGRALAEIHITDDMSSVPPAGWRRRAGRHLFQALARTVPAAEDPPAHEELGELHLPGGPLSRAGGSRRRSSCRQPPRPIDIGGTNTDETSLLRRLLRQLGVVWPILSGVVS